MYPCVFPQHWSKLQARGYSPRPRWRHAACCIASPLTGDKHPLLLVERGCIDGEVFKDTWMLDIERRVWNKASCWFVNYMLWMCAFGLQKESTGFVHVQVTLPKGIQPRCQHTATAFSLGPNFRVLVLFGGRRAHIGEPVAETTLLYFGECGYSFIALYSSS